MVIYYLDISNLWKELEKFQGLDYFYNFVNVQIHA